MHQESANKLNAGDGMFFPPAFFPVIFHIVGSGILIHTDNTMVTDGNPVGILSKVVNNGLCTVKGFLAVRNPVLVITKVQKFLESIMIDIVYKGLQKFNPDFRTHFPHIKINSKKMEKAIDK